MVNAFDREIILGVNRLVNQSKHLDEFINFLSYSDLVKGGVLMALVWWVWFQCKDAAAGCAPAQRVLLATLTGCLLGMAVTRTITHVAPYRDRPLHVAELHLKTVRGEIPADSNDTNSFPSDHATLFWALATGFFFISRRLGWAVAAYVLLFISFPRLYLGVHFPSDLLVGGLIGVVAVWITNRPWLHEHVFARVLVWGERYPSPFYMGLFLFTYQVGAMFNDVRVLLHAVFGTH
ncbi:MULTISPECIES: phosphatase PAP2 family protein [Hymenobacter]|uniref:Phosphatase PAP2 family protein n=1 Tax=Hymenobacter jejuensis TaxID=2502781 RepID=A0A5B7ZZB0_9BACT|nr:MULTISPECIES: phosphatase PAP2 family protein [Hymenobacter]MBC6991250.1 phosphatase PAP2 family protein [Hymenobacter sp. BT491]QDA60378.1 phosphatase PAP2 family protein [Hymenobacter jejuensis]